MSLPAANTVAHRVAWHLEEGRADEALALLAAAVGRLGALDELRSYSAAVHFSIQAGPLRYLIQVHPALVAPGFTLRLTATPRESLSAEGIERTRGWVAEHLARPLPPVRAPRG